MERLSGKIESWNGNEFKAPSESNPTFGETFLADFKMAAEQREFFGSDEMLSSFIRAYSLTEGPVDEDDIANFEKLAKGLSDPDGNGLEAGEELLKKGFKGDKIQFLADKAIIHESTQPTVAVINTEPMIVGPEAEKVPPVWYDELDKDLTEASRAPRIWKNPKDHGKGKRSDDQIEADRKAIREATERIRAHGVNTDGLSERETRLLISDARRMVFDGAASVRSGMTVEEAEKVLAGMNIDVKRVRDASGVGGNDPAVEPIDTKASELDKIQKQAEVMFDMIPDSKNRISELRRLLKDAKNLETRAWIYSKIQSLETAPENDKAQADKDLDYVLNPMNFGDNLKVRQQRAGQWVAKNLDSYPFTVAADGSKIYPDNVAEILNIANGDNVQFGVARDGEGNVRKDSEGKDELEEDLIRQFCLEQVFEMGPETQAHSSGQILTLLTAHNGFLVTGLLKTQSEAQALIGRTREIWEELGLDNWIAVRKTLGEHGKLKGTAEITTATLTEGLFVPLTTEQWLAGVYSKKDHRIVKSREIHLPGEKGPIDLEKKVSEAMRDLKRYFDKTDYYVYLGTSTTEKEDIYRDLGINKYVGEAAFSLLLSHLILTECAKTSTDDPFKYMISGGERRVAAFGVDPIKDPSMRAQDQALMAKGVMWIMNPETGKIYKEDELVRKFGEVEGKQKYKGVKELTENFLVRNLPCHLIPTGRTAGGIEHLDAGDWLKWRVNNTYTMAERNLQITGMEEGKGIIVQVAADAGVSEAELKVLVSKVKDKTAVPAEIDQLDSLKKATKKRLNTQVIANDTQTRKEEMTQALAILEAYKTAMKADSGVKTLLALRAALAVMSKVKYSGAGFVTDGLIDKEFCYGVVEYDENGNITKDERVPLSHDEWATKAMITACQVWMFTHSGADYGCETPLTLKAMARAARDMLSHNPLNDKDAYFGFDPKIRGKYRAQFVAYMNNLWKWTRDVYTFADETNQADLPRWYQTEGALPEGVLKAAADSKKPDEKTKDFPKNAWDKVKKELRL